MKYKILMIFTLFAVITSIFVQSLTDDVVNNGISSNTLPQDAEITTATAESFIETYWNLLTFNANITATDPVTDIEYVVLEVPVFINIIFLIFNIAVGWIVLELIIELLKAVIPL